jgi:hypothetical protein
MANDTELRYVGKPDGPVKYVAELGLEVPTFRNPVGGKWPGLSWHVPPQMRGFFRPEDLANFNADKDYRIDKFGYVLCYAKTKTTGNLCNKRAVNRWPRCSLHGARLHPNDMIILHDGTEAEQPVTRYQQFLVGDITTDDLDDEELTSFGFRKSNGGIFKPKRVPREMVNAFTKAIYDRALVELRVHTVRAAETLAGIMTDKSNDAAIRLKAAEAILDRNLGKATQVVAITGSQPWEEIFDGISTATREESRAARGIIGERESTPQQLAIEADVVELPTDVGDIQTLSGTTESGNGQPRGATDLFAGNVAPVKPVE